MSQDAPTSRKAKRAQRDADRHRGGKKRKHGEVEDEHDVAQTELQQDFIPLNGNGGSDATATTQRRTKKLNGHQEAVVSNTEGAEDAEAPKRKKRRKGKNRAAQDEEADGDDGEDSRKPTKSRFILFIGNLPYSTTDASLQAHFKKIAPFTLRHRTDPKTKKSKGFAFLEFENFDRMKTCLKLYHHSMFNPAQAEAGIDEDEETKTKTKAHNDKAGRRINVELTAGGGGSKAEGRREKIKAKNVKLDEQRKRRAEAERKEKEKERHQNKASGTTSGEKEKPKNDLKDDTTRIHPSRLARVKR